MLIIYLDEYFRINTEIKQNLFHYLKLYVLLECKSILFW